MTSTKIKPKNNQNKNESQPAESQKEEEEEEEEKMCIKRLLLLLLPPTPLLRVNKFTQPLFNEKAAAAAVACAFARFNHKKRLFTLKNVRAFPSTPSSPLLSSLSLRIYKRARIGLGGRRMKLVNPRERRRRRSCGLKLTIINSLLLQSSFLRLKFFSLLAARRVQY